MNTPDKQAAGTLPTTQPAIRSGAIQVPDGEQSGRFRLMRYFMLTSLVAFTVVGLTLLYLQRGEERYFAKVQQEQTDFYAQSQRELAKQQNDAARRNLLVVHESGQVNLARMFSNTLWSGYVAPLLAHAQSLAVEGCRTQPSGDAKRACLSELGRRIQASPHFAVLDKKAHEMMSASTVFKIKVFDLRGVTVYSSEHSQIGEDKSDNAGWISARDGIAASELTHRDRFSAFEKVVENRDLISSYLPVYTAGGTKPIGVFEIYSDVTPLLGQIQSASQSMGRLTAENQRQVERVAAENMLEVTVSSDKFLAIVGGLLALLYLTLLLVVGIGQRTIDAQARESELAAMREENWHREKMAALAAMSANVSHEVGNPLATISMCAESIRGKHEAGQDIKTEISTIIEQTQRIAGMTRQIADFAAARSEAPQPIDINRTVSAICEFMGFDQRFRNCAIEVRAAGELPSRTVVPDHFNDALMNLLLLACVEGEVSSARSARRILVETSLKDTSVMIRIVGAGAPAQQKVEWASRFDSAQRRVVSMGGTLSCLEGLCDAVFELMLPATSAA